MFQREMSSAFGESTETRASLLAEPQAGGQARRFLRSALRDRADNASSTRRVHVNAPGISFLVLRTDNTPRVRDGYSRLSTRGHVRASLTGPDEPICRKNVPAHARSCPRVPPQNLHGKEGVDGSSPSEV
jgi:hypothetical protein